MVARGEDGGCIDELLVLDESRRALVTEVENLQAERNKASKGIGGLMGQGKEDEAEEKKDEMRGLGEKTDALNLLKAKADDAFNA